MFGDIYIQIGWIYILGGVTEPEQDQIMFDGE
jgi:hypothetical protein